MKRSGGVFITECVTLPKFKMHSNFGAFPYIVFDDNGYPVLGELYRVDTLEYLDMLEGYPRHYDRTTITVIDENGNHYVAYVYIPNDSNRVSELPTIEPEYNSKFGREVLCWNKKS